MVDEYQQYLGARADIRTSIGLTFRVEVLDIRRVFGRIDALVTNGRGESAWVAFDKLVFNRGKQS